MTTLTTVQALEKIERLLPGKDLNKASLAAKAGISPGTISRLKPPYKGMRFGKCQAIAHSLGVTVDWLFDDRQPYPPPESATVVILQTDPRLVGLEDELPPKMTRAEILEAIWDWKRAHVRRPAEGSPGGASPDQAGYDRANAVPRPRPADGEGTGQRKAGT